MVTSGSPLAKRRTTIASVIHSWSTTKLTAQHDDRGVKKPTPRRQARHYGITFALEPGDLAATSRELWLATVTCDDDRSSSMIRRTIPAGSLVIIDSLCGTTSAYDRNHCRIFFEGLVWDRCPVATLRPLSEDDDEDDEE